MENGGEGSFESKNRTHSTVNSRMKKVNEEEVTPLENVNVFLGETENENEDELPYHNGNNHVVRIFEQKGDICLESHSVFAVRQSSHPSICPKCYKSKDDVNIIKCFICST